MRIILLVLFISLASAHTMQQVVEGIADMFSISEQEAQKCIDDAQATKEDIDAYIQAMRAGNITNNDTIRRAMCALTCAAQLQGTMVGPKLELNRINQLIEQEMRMAAEEKREFYKFVVICSKEVENETDQCEVGRIFLTCLRKNLPTFR